MLKFIIAIPLIMHGLANLAGVFAPWTKEMNGFKNAPWLFSQSITYQSNIGRAFSLIWLASAVCLIIAGTGLIMGRPWWPPVAIAGCICSLFAILPWWRAVVPGAYFGAIFDLVVVILLASPLKEMLFRVVT